MFSSYTLPGKESLRNVFYEYTSITVLPKPFFVKHKETMHRDKARLSTSSFTANIAMSDV